MTRMKIANWNVNSIRARHLECRAHPRRRTVMVTVIKE
jgi:exonuclease III